MVSVPASTIDAEIVSLGLPPPYFIKLDTHGHEVPILEGARETLEKTEFLLVEVYNLRLDGTGEAFWEFCSLMERIGFRPLYLCDPLFRPRDGMLWQFELLFARAERPEFQVAAWC